MHQRSPQSGLIDGLRILVVCCVIPAFSGCINPMYARLPVFWAGHPQSERQAFQDQDPFPDPDIGPNMFARPRAFARPRTESRRAAEQRIFHGLPSGPEAAPPGYPRGGMGRPNAAW